jgi:hypothetical protein
VGHTKDFKKDFASSPIKNSGSAISANGRTGTAASETNADTSSLNLNLSADPLNTNFSGFASGRNLFRHSVTRSLVMQAVSNREAFHSAGPYHRPDKSSDLSTAVTRQAVYPGLILRRAAGKDTHSGGPATPEIAAPIGAWPVVPQLSHSLPVNLPTSRHEGLPALMMGKTTHERTGLFRQTVYPGSILGPAAREDTPSGGPATPTIATLVGSRPVIPELAHSLPLNLLTGRNEASPTPMMGKTSHERTGLFRQAVYPGLILRLAAGKDTRSGGPATPATSTPSGAWPVTPELSRSLPLKLLTSRNQASPTPMMGKTSHEMPLFYKSAANTREGTSPDHQAHRSAVPNRPVQLPDRNLTTGANILEAQNLPETPSAPGTETAAAGSRMDPDELGEKIWHKIMRKLTIEQERRGRTPWI